MNQKTIQALHALAEEYSAFEATMYKVTLEHDEGDVLHDELERARKDRDRLQDELDCSCEDMATAAREFSNCWAAPEAATFKPSSSFRRICTRRAAHEAICAEARKAWQRTCDLKRKASEAQDNVFSHRETTRRTSNEHARAEALVDDGLGSLGQAVRAAAQAAYSVTCGVPTEEATR